MFPSFRPKGEIFFLAILILCFLFSGCTQTVYFEKNFYENVSGIKFPENYKLIATADNGEFVTITILDLDRQDCSDFSQKNNFRPIPTTDSITMLGMPFLDSAYRQLPDYKRLLRNWGSTGKDAWSNCWTYVLDTVNCRLYCEIVYPD